MSVVADGVEVLEVAAKLVDVEAVTDAEADGIEFGFST